MESKIRKTLVNVYSLVLSIFVCFIVGVALSKISDKVDMQALENLMLSGAFKQCRPERAETLQYMILTVLFPVLYMVFIPLIKKRSDNSLFFSQKMLNLINFAIFLTFAFLVLINSVVFRYILFVNIIKSFLRQFGNCNDYIISCISCFYINWQ